MLKLIKIEKLSQMVQYENPKTSTQDNSAKKWTKNVPLILIDDKGKIIMVKKWVYVNNNDELVYDRRHNLWTQGSEYYDIGKSHIKEVYVVMNIIELSQINFNELIGSAETKSENGGSA